MEVSFLDKDKEAEFDYDDDCVKFWAIVDREACQCFIEGFALQLFGDAGVKATLETFEANKDAIHRIARTLLEGGRGSDGRLYISYEDVLRLR